MRVIVKLLLAATALMAVPAYSAEEPPVVDHVDLERYMGRWYEIAALPQWFERNCFASRADYTLRDDGKVDVLNSCQKGSLQGRLKEAHAVARVVDPATNAKLKVQFFWPFEGDYWILDLADDYSYVMVGSPNLKSLWILSRETTLDEATLSLLLNRAETLGFDVARVKLTPQKG